MDETSSRAQVLTELRTEQEALLEFGDALDAKLNMLFGSGSLVLSLFSALNLIQPGPWWYWALIIVLAVVYFCVLFRLGFGLSPRLYSFPLKADWEHLHKVYLTLEGEQLYNHLIRQNILSIEDNRKVTDRKARTVKFGIWALPAILVILTVSRLLLAVFASATAVPSSPIATPLP